MQEYCAKSEFHPAARLGDAVSATPQKTTRTSSAESHIGVEHSFEKASSRITPKNICDELDPWVVWTSDWRRGSIFSALSSYK